MFDIHERRCWTSGHVRKQPSSQYRSSLVYLCWVTEAQSLRRRRITEQADAARSAAPVRFPAASENGCIPINVTVPCACRCPRGNLAGEVLFVDEEVRRKRWAVCSR